MYGRPYAKQGLAVEGTPKRYLVGGVNGNGSGVKGRLEAADGDGQR